MMGLSVLIGAFAASLALAQQQQQPQAFDTVISGGRVLDPESGLDAVRHVGIRAGRIVAVSEQPLAGGAARIDAAGLVVAPGFIDLHWHGRDVATARYQVMDGVTAALELEVGTADLDKWYAARAGKSLIHYGASIGHIPVRMALMKDPGDFLPSGPAAHRAATEPEIEEMKSQIDAALRQGAPAVGFGVGYTKGASYWEILEMFRVAARHGATCHVHIRSGSSAAAAGSDRLQGLSEVIAAATVTGASLHVVHVNSSGGPDTARMLEMIRGARSRGIDVTTEAYPYTAGATRIESALFDSWSDRAPADYRTLQWMATGERLTRDRFLEYRKQGGLVIIHSNTEERVRLAILDPLTMIASDGFDVAPKNGHPRSAGTFSKVLGKYTREERGLSLMDAIRKMTLMPAQRLEKRVAMMRAKGRVKVGADADLAIFDPAAIRDKATYEQPDSSSEGMRHVLVNGAFVVRNGKVVPGVAPGRPIR